MYIEKIKTLNAHYKSLRPVTRDATTNKATNGKCQLSMVCTFLCASEATNFQYVMVSFRNRNAFDPVSQCRNAALLFAHVLANWLSIAFLRFVALRACTGRKIQTTPAPWFRLWSIRKFIEMCLNSTKVNRVWIDRNGHHGETVECN